MRRTRGARVIVAVAVMALPLAACGETTSGRGDKSATDGGVGATDGSGSELQLAGPAPLDVERPAPEADEDAAALAAGLNRVGYELLLTEPADDDAVLSPLSTGLAFGMADVGAAEGPAAEPLAALFDYPVQGEDRLAAFNTLQRQVTDVGGPVVALANRQFPDEDFEVVDGFDRTLARWFGARVEPLPLQAQPDASRARINRYVATQTQELIPELLPEGFVNPRTVLVLVNALYLEADWARPFGKYPTGTRSFTRLDGSTTEVPMLHDLELPGPAAVTDAWAAATIPYAGSQLEMVLVVPSQGRYEEVRRGLADGLVGEVDEALAEAPPGRPFELWLPRFEASTEVDLRAAFEVMGAGGIFGAEFPGIAPGVTLEAGVHAADVAVDEVGTVAAAATGLGFEESGPPEPEVVVDASRPFLWLVRHRATGAALFAGQVTDPSDPGPAPSG